MISNEQTATLARMTVLEKEAERRRNLEARLKLAIGLRGCAQRETALSILVKEIEVYATTTLDNCSICTELVPKDSLFTCPNCFANAGAEGAGVTLTDICYLCFKRHGKCPKCRATPKEMGRIQVIKMCAAEVGTFPEELFAAATEELEFGDVLQRCCMSECLSIVSSTQTCELYQVHRVDVAIESKFPAVSRETATPFIFH